MKRVLAIIGYILSVGFNIPHLVGAYFMAGESDLPHLLIWVTMFVLDFGILVLAINGREWETYIFACVIFLLNLLYYWGGIPFPNLWAEWVSCLPGLLFSAVPAFFVYYFSELISELFAPVYQDNSQKLDLIRYELGQFSLTIDNNRDVIDIFRPILEANSRVVGKTIKVEGVKAEMCECGVFHTAGSNREGDRLCDNCGNTINWS